MWQGEGHPRGRVCTLATGSSGHRPRAVGCELGGGQEGQGPNLSCQVGPDTRGACELEAPHEPSLVGTHLGVKRTTDGSP